MIQKRKILLYNWIKFDEKENKGGGVTVYIRNLIEAMIQTEEWEIYFISSGRAYNRKRKEIYIEETINCFEKNCKTYQIVNSPVLSPAYLSFPNTEDYLYERKLKDIVREFIDKIEGLDIIHFQNLEGLSLSVLELKSEFPQIRFIYTLHNYFLFCPQVMLWKNDRENCLERQCGSICINCMPKDVWKEKVIQNQQINYDREHNGWVDPNYLKEQKVMEETYKNYFNTTQGKVDRKREELLARIFEAFRRKNIEYINQYIDKILAVSNRVYEIAASFGVEVSKMKVDYIGTEIAKYQLKNCAYPFSGGIFHICYLGYMRRMKGFYFFLEALERMPESLSAGISVSIAVNITESSIMDRINRLKQKFADIIIYKGYRREELPRILKNIQLGILPVLWEDNLPQTAIEMKANGVAVLSSDLGGAKELTSAKEFVFKAGNIEDFTEKLSFIINNPNILQEYWKNSKPLVTMKEHIDSLVKCYDMV